MGRALQGRPIREGKMGAPLAQVATTPKQRGPQSPGGHPHKATLRPPCFHPTWCPRHSPCCSHLLVPVYHALATGVKQAEGAQDGFLGVCPWEAEGVR